MNCPFTKYIMNNLRVFKKSMCNFNNTFTQFNIYLSALCIQTDHSDCTMLQNIYWQFCGSLNTVLHVKIHQTRQNL